MTSTTPPTAAATTTESISSSSVVGGNLVLSVRQYLKTRDDETTTTTTAEGQIRLLLASQSPRRREILDMMGLVNRYEVIPSPLNEEALAIQLLSGTTTGSNDPTTTELVHFKSSGQIITDPSDYTRILAEEKAMALAKQIQSEYDQFKESSSSASPTLVLGSDTIVVLDGTILEKPIDTDHAVRMLTSLAGRTHVVLTGVALVQVVPPPTSSLVTTSTSTVQLVSSFTDTAQVTFVNLTEDDIRTYVATGEPMDKSGSYGIQGIGGQLIHTIHGDFFTVMGLPMHRTSTTLASAINNLRSKNSP